MGCVMKLKKIKRKKGVHLDLTQAKSKYIIETSRNDPKLPALFVFVGVEGVGKHM